MSDVTKTPEKTTEKIEVVTHSFLKGDAERLAVLFKKVYLDNEKLTEAEIDVFNGLNVIFKNSDNMSADLINETL